MDKRARYYHNDTNINLHKFQEAVAVRPKESNATEGLNNNNNKP